jgi:hypothetical protein
MASVDGDSPQEGNSGDPNEWPYIIKLWTEDYYSYLNEGETVLSIDFVMEQF